MTRRAVAAAAALLLAVLLLPARAADCAVPALAPDPFLGHWVSADGDFRAVVYEKQGEVRVLLYGTLVAGNAQVSYVGRSVASGRKCGVMSFTLAPRALYRAGGDEPGVAGHRSELPPQALERGGTTWLLRPADGGLVLDCAGHPSGCGIPGPVFLRPQATPGAGGG